LRRTLGCVRLVYNKPLATGTDGWTSLTNQGWYEGQEGIDYVETSSMLRRWNKTEGLDLIKQVSSVRRSQRLRHWQSAFSNFFAGKTKYPKFKKRRKGGRAELTKAAFNRAGLSSGLVLGMADGGGRPYRGCLNCGYDRP